MGGRMQLSTVLWVALAAGCGGSSSDVPTKWVGAMPHLRIVGTLMGETIDINLSGAAASSTTAVWCEREYQVPTDTAGNPIYSMGHNSEVRIKAPVTINGQSRSLDLELKEHNFQSDASGTVTTAVPRDDNNPPCAASGCAAPKNMWLQWVWYGPDGSTQLYKQAAQSGQYTAGEFTGTPDSTGLEIMENSGTVGGFLTGQWSAAESITASFDAHCTANDIDNG